MLISLKNIRSIALALTLITGFSQAYADSDMEENVTNVLSKYSEESAKSREDHLQELRKLHLNYVNELYDKKLAHYKEMAEIWKNAKSGDKAGLKSVREEIKAKNKAFKESEKNFRKEFRENVLGKKEKEFRHGNKERMKGMRKKVQKE